MLSLPLLKAMNVFCLLLIALRTMIVHYCPPHRNHSNNCLRNTDKKADFFCYNIFYFYIMVHIVPMYMKRTILLTKKSGLRIDIIVATVPLYLSKGTKRYLSWKVFWKVWKETINLKIEIKTFFKFIFRVTRNFYRTK